MVVLEDGSTVEASTIGNEGMDGLYLLVDATANPYRINVQVGGEMLRISAAAFGKVRAESSALSQLLMKKKRGHYSLRQYSVVTPFLPPVVTPFLPSGDPFSTVTP